MLIALERAGFGVAEVPVRMRSRRAGRSSLSPFKALGYLARVALHPIFDPSRETSPTACRLLSWKPAIKAFRRFTREPVNGFGAPTGIIQGSTSSPSLPSGSLIYASSGRNGKGRGLGGLRLISNH